MKDVSARQVKISIICLSVSIYYSELLNILTSPSDKDDDATTIDDRQPQRMKEGVCNMTSPTHTVLNLSF